jgi:hypothetical protein
MVQPGVEVGLERLDALVKPAAHGRPEELLQHRAVEALVAPLRDLMEDALELLALEPPGWRI